MRVVALVLVLASWCSFARADETSGSASATDIDAERAPGSARAEPDGTDADADAALRAAVVRSQADPATALVDLEALGARRPLTRWSDNAWSEAARLAEAAGDYARARRALEQIIAIDQDSSMVRRARATIERLGANTGGGQWDAIARQHDQLVSAIFAGGDPHAALAQLESLVRANPAYPRAVAASTSIARGWEMEDDADTALAWMRSAADLAGAEERGQRSRLELARMAIRAGELDVAENELRTLRASSAVDRAALANVEADLASAERRQWMRRGVWALLALLGIGALAILARDLGSVRVASRRLVRPPIEVLFLVPISAVVIGIAATGNPLVARSIITIAIAGIAVAWISGVLVDVAREHRRLSRSRLAIHLACVTLAIAGIVFLAVERGGVIHLLLETWRGGHALR